MRRRAAPPPAPIAPEPVTLSLRLDGHDRFVHFIDDPRALKRVEVLELEVEPWHEAAAGWTGRLGPIPNVLKVETEFDPAGHRARIRMVMTARVEAVQLLRAAYTVFYPSRPSGQSGPRIGVQSGADREFFWHAGGGLRPVLPARISGMHFVDYDQVATPKGLVRLDRESQSVELLDRPTGPVVRINPKIHRPVGRRQPDPGLYSASARTVDGRFVITRADDSVVLDLSTDEPLRSTHNLALMYAGCIDASGVGADVASATRLAEVAAVGQIVHSAPPELPVHADLSRVWSLPFASMPLLDHMNRSLAQVRAVMRHHTRALTVQKWPSVSVVLATRRPDLLPVILQQLAAQDHPGIEIVVGCHGFTPPDIGTWSPEVRDRVGPVLGIDQGVRFGEVLQRLTAASSGDLVTKVDDDDLYGPHHLADVMTAWIYSDAQLVGRKMTLIRHEATDSLLVRRLFRENYRSTVAGGSMMIARHDLDSIGGWRPQVRGIEQGMRTRLWDSGALSYACSGPGYVYVRHDQGHTWDVPMNRFSDTHYETTLQGLPGAALGIVDLADWGDRARVPPRANGGTRGDG
ncbi:MAG: hypothetical protein WBQ48_02625 [Aeromicrobium sp.]